MKITKSRLAALALSLCFSGAFAGDGELAEHFEPLKPFIGKTWKGVFTNSTPEKPIIDIARWERALNGQAVRHVHSLNDGEYGGETMIIWNKEKERLEYYYFTTQGFMTQGTMRFEDGKLISHEHVTGNENGITEVKSIGEKLPDGRMKSSSQYLQNGKWVDGHGAVYEEAPGAKIVFK